MQALFYSGRPIIPARSKFTRQDLNFAANDAILAMDGKLARADALLVARAVLESFGLTAHNPSGSEHD